MTVLEEDPASLEYLCLRDELLSPGSLAAPQGDDVEVKGAPAELLREAQQLGGGIGAYEGKWM